MKFFSKNIMYRYLAFLNKNHRQLCCIINESKSGAKRLIICALCPVWQYGLWSFQTGGTKLERFLPKNQHTQRKLFSILRIGLERASEVF